MAENQFYSMDDFRGVRKIDAHLHYNSYATTLTDFAEDCSFRLVSINTNVPYFPSIPQQQDYVVNHPAFKTTLFYLTTFDSTNVFVTDWLRDQLKYLRDSFKKGALAFKVWKDIGMSLRDQDDNFIFIDDALFRPFFDHAEKNGWPVVGHIGEPRNCWLPLDRMTVENDRNYFSQHAEFHMHLHPEFPSYEQLIQSYTSMLRQHPRLHYVGAHFGSLEWSVEEIAKQLDNFPNMAMDTAERIAHMQFQTVADRDTVRDFFISYSDRILYGTDIIVDETTSSDAMVARARGIWQSDWRYFVTDDELISPFVEGSFRGLKLPKEAIDNIYYRNAVKWYNVPA